MSNNLELRKYKLISLIIAMQDEDSVAQLETYLGGNTPDLPIIAPVDKPIHKALTVEELIRDHNHKHISREGINFHEKEIDIQEAIEESLKSLNQ